MVYYEATVGKSHVIARVIVYCVFLCGIDRGLTFWIRELGAAQLPCWNRWNFAWRCARIAGSTCSSAKFSQIRMVVPLLGKPPHAMLWRFAGKKKRHFPWDLEIYWDTFCTFGMCWDVLGINLPWLPGTLVHANHNACNLAWLQRQDAVRDEGRGKANESSPACIELVGSNRLNTFRTKKNKWILYSKIYINIYIYIY